MAISPLYSRNTNSALNNSPPASGFWQLASAAMTTLQLHPYLEQTACWPRSGRHILAQFDADSILVYQAYNERIGHFAAQNGHFGGDFSFNRMSWIKPNFLWMMYRSGWAEKYNQTCILAVRIRRSLWEEILASAVPSTFVPELYESDNAWKADVAHSEVRLQWDPDHSPRGGKLARRAVQLGLRGDILRRFATEALAIEDISDFVREQKTIVQTDDWSSLLTLREEVYPVLNPETARRVGVDSLEVGRASSQMPS
ncbi:hypothetical protein IAD21_02972 [Abditibacteriota bacterium]|nr:hypothetical protein IAD21_02972 [Abditibacteriota bacterium]